MYSEDDLFDGHIVISASITKLSIEYSILIFLYVFKLAWFSNLNKTLTVNVHAMKLSTDTAATVMIMHAD